MDHIKFCKGDSRSHTDNPDKKYARPLSLISYDEVINLARYPLKVEKDKCPFLMPVDVPSRIKSKIMQGNFTALVADIDATKNTIAESNALIQKILLAGRGGYFLIYTSRSATEDNQKFHAIIPTPPLTAYRWTVAMQVLNDKLRSVGIEPDLACLNHSQPFYLPNEGEYFDYYNNDKSEIFNPLSKWNTEMIAKH